MNKTLKYVLYVIALLVAVFISVLAYIAVTVNPNDYKPQITDLVKEETQRTLTFEGDIKLKLFPVIGLNLGKTVLSGPKGQGEFASVGNVGLDVAWLPLLSSKLVLDRIVIDGLHASLIRYKDGSTNYDDLTRGGSKGSGGKKPEFDIGGVDIKNSSISYDDMEAGKKTEVANISIKTGHLKQGLHTDVSFGFDVRADKTAMRLDMQSGLLFTPERYELDGMELKFKSGQYDISVKGKMDADMTKQDVSADISSGFDQSRINAKLGMTNFSAPAYRFDVRIDKLDADKYLAKNSGGSGAEKPFDLSFLKKLDANGTLAIAALKVQKLQLSNFDMKLRASGGKLELNPVTADLYHGKSAGKVVVEALSVPRFTFRDNLSGISIGPLLKDMMDKDLLDGTGDVAADVTMSGNLVSALKRTLNGKASLHLTNGAIRGIDVAATLRSIKSKIGSPGSQTGAANTAEKTDFSELAASFDIKNGVAHNSDLSMKSPLLRLGGEGDIDIGKSVMNYLAKASVVATLQGQGGADLASLNGVTVPVRISGPFDSLHYSVDFASLASTALKSKVEQKKTEIKTKVKDQLLKGLFGQ